MKSEMYPKLVPEDLPLMNLRDWGTLCKRVFLRLQKKLKHFLCFENKKPGGKDSTHAFPHLRKQFISNCGWPLVTALRNSLQPNGAFLRTVGLFVRVPWWYHWCSCLRDVSSRPLCSNHLSKSVTSVPNDFLDHYAALSDPKGNKTLRSVTGEREKKVSFWNTDYSLARIVVT